MDVVVVGERGKVGGERKVRKQHDLLRKIGPACMYIRDIREMGTPGTKTRKLNGSSISYTCTVFCS